MNSKQQVINHLKPKSEAVWNLIVEAIDKGYNKELLEEDYEIAKETYFKDCAEDIDKGFFRYIIIEDYNIQDDFYYRFYKEDDVEANRGKERFAYIFEDYFSDVQEGENILCIDMQELKAYQIGKYTKYTSEEMI